jgi:tetratricopeptide (TPR) repeat protein
METKKPQSNFSSKLAETEFSLILFRLANTGSFIILAVCFCLLFNTGRLEASINAAKIYQLQQKLIEKPRDVEAHLHLAMEYSLADDFVKAVETYFALLRIDPDNFHAYNNLGILYKKSGQFRDSLHCYKQAERINPDSYWVPYNMGLCYEAMGRMQEARESYGRALSLNPSFTQALQRLRSLSEEGNSGEVPALPGLAESQIYLVDSQGQPKIYSAAKPEVGNDKNPVKALPEKQPPPAVVEPVKVSEKIQKEKEQKKKYRTARKGPAAAIFNQAMDALDSDNIERAIELYAGCIIAERDFLAEPENGLIRKALEYLKERPNRMPEGQFYRGLFIYISGNLEMAVPDMQSYLDQSRSRGKTANTQFVEEAARIIERFSAEKAEREAKEKERAELLAAASIASESVAAPEADQPRPSDYALKRMSVDQIIDEADRLSRESRPQDAAAVLETGLQTEPDDLRLLMKSANAYTDMLLLKGDQEAGKMALLRFEKIFAKAPENSRESVVAQEMIQELKKRIR